MPRGSSGAAAAASSTGWSPSATVRVRSSPVRTSSSRSSGGGVRSRTVTAPAGSAPSSAAVWPLTQPPLPDWGGPQNRDGTRKLMEPNVVQRRGDRMAGMSTRQDPPGTEAPFSLRAIAVPAFGPTVLAALGQGAVLPVVALRARELGASVGVAAFMVGLVGIGQLCAALPAGAVVSRIG